jgi:hypothetical protein
MKGGDVATVLGYVFNQMHLRVEPIHPGWCWGYSYRPNVNNPRVLSCHASATAGDWNAPDHPNGASGTFTPNQVGIIRNILREVSYSVRWGGDFSGKKDEMHFEICVSASTLAPIAARLSGTTPRPPRPSILDEEVEAMLLQRQSDKKGMLIVGGKAVWVTTGADYSAMDAGGLPAAVVSDALFASVIKALGQPVG